MDSWRDTLGIITYIQHFSVNDGPGIRTTVFLKGCILRCKWCHNPENLRRYPEVFHYWPNCKDCGVCLETCPSGALSRVAPRRIKINKEQCITCWRCVEACRYGALVRVGKFIKASEVIAEVEKDYPFYENSGGGMTISGGEPLAQPTFTQALLQGAKEKKIHTALDTNGFASWETLEKILNFTDLVLLDIKHMDPEAHRSYTGASNKLILENAERMVKKVEVRIRIPIIPGFNDSKENMKKTAEFAASLGVKQVDLLPFHPWAGQKYRLFGLEYPYPIGEGYPEEKIKEFARIFKSHGLMVTLGDQKEL